MLIIMGTHMQAALWRKKKQNIKKNTYLEFSALTAVRTGNKCKFYFPKSWLALAAEANEDRFTFFLHMMLQL